MKQAPNGLSFCDRKEIKKVGFGFTCKQGREIYVYRPAVVKAQLTLNDT